MDVIPAYRLLVPALVAQVPELSREQNADALDVLSTHLLWWSDQDARVPIMDRVFAGIAASEACLLGLEASENEAEGGHTRALLLLTYVDLCIRVGQGQWSLQYLIEAARRAGSIRDPNERARVYRKLAYLWGRKLLNPFAAAYFLARCYLVKGVSADVVSKNDPFKLLRLKANV
ncbi:hypothetical protein KJ848_01485 [Patescibacteria group bacterium]|nr:hypothetical protein [Patescibacteria group bacterium]MBU2158833.1 hypothetical protein [Patescibacteria group bacterium]